MSSSNFTVEVSESDIMLHRGKIVTHTKGPNLHSHAHTQNRGQLIYLANNEPMINYSR
jgi:hypothetical protein